MDDALFEIAGAPNPLTTALASLLSGAAPCKGLINADPRPDASMITARCRAFADRMPRGESSLIVTILRRPPAGLAHVAHHQAVAALWAFTQLAALQWALLGIRVNAIGLGASPAGPFEPREQAGRAAFAGPAAPATAEDLVRTIRAMAAWRSMTGQIIRLGV